MNEMVIGIYASIGVFVLAFSAFLYMYAGFLCVIAESFSMQSIMLFSCHILIGITSIVLGVFCVIKAAAEETLICCVLNLILMFIRF